IVTPDAVDKAAKAPAFPSIPGPGSLRPGGIPRTGPIGPIGPKGKLGGKSGMSSSTGAQPALLAIRFTGGPTNTDIMAGEGVTFLQSSIGVQARADRQAAGQAPAHIDGAFIVTVTKSGNSISYFVNGKE